MTLIEHESMPVDIPKKRKHRHRDVRIAKPTLHVWTNRQQNLDEKLSQYNLRISTQDNRDDPRDISNDNTGSITYGNAAVAWKPTKTSWGVGSRATIGEKLDHAELVSGGEQVAEAILSRMIDEELDEGELADTEDTHERMGRRPRLGWCKRKHGRQPTARTQAIPEVVTDIEDWD